MSDASYQRSDGRAADQLRTVSLQKNIAPATTGSVLISMGRTQVICAASVQNQVPGWMRSQNVPGGWVTAEYSMLPYSTDDRSRREVSSGKPSGRTQEIQRLIGRSLRAVVDLEKLGPRTVWLDCDVLQADGGTRTASVTGAFVALRMAINRLLETGKLEDDPITDTVAAVSVGVVESTALLDLCYVEDFSAEVDMNVVMTGSGLFVEVQGTAEEKPFSADTMQAMQDLAAKGVRELTAMQLQSVG